MDIKMTKKQKETSTQLQADGFSVRMAGRGLIASLGNDFRLILDDGSQRRAIGARK